MYYAVIFPFVLAPAQRKCIKQSRYMQYLLWKRKRKCV